MKKIFLLLLITVLSGCGKSLMKLTMKTDPQPYRMFGKIPSRNFYVPVEVSDSLKLLWEQSAHGSFPNSSVTIYDNVVFINDLSGRIFAYNIFDGKQVGMLKYKGAVFSSPLLFNSTIIFPVVLEKDKITELVFYDFHDGNEIKVDEIEGKVLSEMIAFDESIILLTDEGTVLKYNLRGDLEWEKSTGKRTHCSPSADNGLIVFGNDNGEIISLNINDGKEKFVNKFEGIFNGAVVIDGNSFFISNENGKVYSFNLKDGTLNWEFDTGSRILMSPALDDKNLVVGNLSGNLFSIDIKSGNLNWEKTFPGVLNATPLLTKNRVIIPDSFLAYYFIDKSNGELIKKISVDGRGKLTPVYFKDILFIGYDDGILRAYEFVD